MFTRRADMQAHLHKPRLWHIHVHCKHARRRHTVESRRRCMCRAAAIAAIALAATADGTAAGGRGRAPRGVRVVGGQWHGREGKGGLEKQLHIHMRNVAQMHEQRR